MEAHRTTMVSYFIYSVLTLTPRHNEHNVPKASVSYSDNNKTQMDFILVRHRDQKLVTDAKAAPTKQLPPSIGADLLIEE